MCTILLLWRSHPVHPLIVAANRDELYERRASGAEILVARPRAVGGRDLRQGGSWMGVTATGLFVGLTNQRSHRPPRPALRSRGAVVVEALRRRTVSEIRRYLESLDLRHYNAFNLVFGDADTLELAYARPEAGSLDLEPVPIGASVLCNDRLGSPEFPKAARALELGRGLADLSWAELVPALQRLLADHGLPAPEHIPEPPASSVLPRELLRQLQALCIHTPAYGTCSSTIVALEPGRVAHYLFAAGPPCRSSFEERTDLLQG
jgi:uncharacterized protein with NRDE domain